MRRSLLSTLEAFATAQPKDLPGTPSGRPGETGDM